MATCALSGLVPEEPVVSIKTGHMYEKRLILKHIEATSQCPITRTPMTVDDLIAVKTTSPVVRPRPPTATSFPAMLKLLQSEWDASVLEAFNLKRNVDTLRQELAHALYQLDAANRVIARLIKERDEAQTALGQVDASVKRAVAAVAAAPAAASSAQAMSDEPVAAASAGVPAELVAAFTDKAKELSSTRRAKVKAATAAAAGNLTALATADVSAAVSTAVAGGVTTLAPVLGGDAALAAPIAIVGGSDGSVGLFDTAANAMVAATDAAPHKAAVTSVAAWSEAPGSALVAISGAADGSAALLKGSLGAGGLAATPLQGHAGEITAVDVHPTGRVVATASADKSFRLWDASTGAPLCTFTAPELGAVTAFAFHPDGLFVVAGDSAGKLFLVELTALKVERIMHEHAAPISSVSCSPNGYILATTDTSGKLCVWDLRSQTCIKTLLPVTETGSAGGASLKSARFDAASGSALVAATGNGAVVYKAEDWSVIKVLVPAGAEEPAEAVAAAVFGPAGGSVVAAGAGKNKCVRVFPVAN